MRNTVVCDLCQTLSEWSNKRTEMGNVCGMYGGEKGAYTSLVGKPEANKVLGRHRHWWAHNVKIDVGETGTDKWHVLWNRVMNHHFP